MSQMGQQRRFWNVRDEVRLSPIAALKRTCPRVAFVPGSDICTAPTAPLFDHLVGKREQLGWNFETQRLGGLDVDHEIEPCGLLDGDFAWFHPAQNLIDQIGGAPEHVRKISPIRDQTSRFDELPK